MASVDDYLGVIDSDSSDRRTRLKSSLYSAADSSPDAESALVKISRRSGIPVEALRLDNGQEAKRRIAAEDADHLIDNAPATADLLSDPETAKALWDDAQALVGVEDVFKVKPVNPMSIASPNDRSAAKRAPGVMRALWEGAKASPELVNQSLARTGQAVAEFVDWSLQVFPDDTGVRKRVSEIAKDSADYWKRAAKAKMGTYAPGSAESYAQQAGSSIGTSALAAPFGMGGENAALAMFGLFADGGYQEMRDAGYNPLAAGAVDVSNRIMEGLTEKIGLDRIYKGGDDVLKTAIKFTLGDLGGEEINTIYNAISDKVNLKPDMTWGDLAQQVLDTAIVTGIAGPLQGASMSGAARVSESLYSAYERRNAIKQQTDFLTALGDSVKSTKSFERLPEKVQELVKRLKEQAGGSVDNVYIPADRWSMLWQDANLDPGDVAEEILGDRQQYQEAVAANSDIVIPLENFIKLAGTDNYNEILNDVRLNPGEMTPREHAEWTQNMDAEVERILAEAQGEEAAAAPDRQVYDDVLGQLIAIGTERGTAEKQAALWQATMRTLAARAGTDAMTLFRQYAPTVTRPLPDVLAKRVSVDMQIDPLIDRLRAGDLGAKEADIFGPSLIEFIRSKGGLKDSGGELKSRDAGKGIVRKNGMELDRAREAAVESGYLPEDATISDFLDALDAELRGKPRYSPGNQNNALLEERETLQQFKDFLDQNGIDLEGMSNEEVRKVLGQGATQGAMWQYPAISPEDAKVAKQQVVAALATVAPESTRAMQLEIMLGQYNAIIDGGASYADFQPAALFQSAWHGSPHTFGKFSLDAIGTGEGAQAYGYGLYFAGSKEVAEWYKEKLSRDDGTIVRRLLDAINNAGVSTSTLPMEAFYLFAAEYAYNKGDMAATLKNASKTIRMYESDGQHEEASDLSAVKDAVESAAANGADFPTVSAGRLYKVELAPEEDEYLLWDKPLSEQSEKVKAAISDDKKLDEWFNSQKRRDAGVKLSQRAPWEDTDSVTGRDFYRTLSDMIGRDNHERSNGAIRNEPDDKAASEYLHSLGIRGIKYLDGTSRGKGEGNYNYVIFNDMDVTITQVEQRNNGTKRGFFDLSNNTIGLLENADLSTFLHESAHFFWTVMRDLATRPDAPEQIVEDYQTLLAWFGTDNPQREHLEQFARGFEQYLGEGKAPTPELQPLFQRFKAWMIQVYRSLKNLNVDLTDEVRGVFDRMIATDEEIKAAREGVGAKPIFATAEEAGMTEAEFAAYQSDAAKAGQREEERLTSDLMREYQREQEKWWKERRAEVLSEVEAEAKQNPVYEAINLLTTGKLFDGTEHPAGPMKLDKEELTRRYGKEFLKRLPRGFHHIYATEGGTSVDLVAEAFGFDSGDAMLQQMIEAPKLKDWVEAETDIRMRKEYGDKLTDGTIAEDAMSAVHSDERAKVLRAELAAIRKKQREVKPYVDAAKDQGKEEQARLQKEREYERRWFEAETRMRIAVERGAAQGEIDRLRAEVKTAAALRRVSRQDMYAGIPPVESFKMAAALSIGQKKIFEIDPFSYARAEQKAAREAFDAAAKGDYVKAGEAKQRQILNHYLYREAKAAKDDAEKILQHVKGVQSKRGQERIAKAGGPFLDQVNALLERYQFQRTSNAELEQRETLREWAARMEEEGLIIPISDEMLEAATVINYRQATTDELWAFYDALRVIESAARQYREFRTQNDLLEWEDVKDDLVGAILNADLKSTGELGRPNNKMKLRKGLKVKGAAAWRWFDAEHLKIEQMVEWLDSGRIDGPWAKYFFDMADHAQTKEYDYHATVTKALQDLNDLMPKEWHGRMLDDTRARLRGIDGAVNRYTLISIALNTGNEGNLQQLLDGNMWNEEELDAALEELSAEDWQYIQGVWDIIDSLWPEIEALQKRMTGLPPKKVEAREIQNQHGTFRGGYFPLVYDPKTSQVGEKQAAAGEDVTGFLKMNYGNAATFKGHTKERMETVVARPLLDFEKVVARHMGKVIKDLSHREAIFNLNRILRAPEIKALLTDRMGEDYYRQMRAWMQTLISDRADSLASEVTLLPRLARGLRTNTAIVTMGFKISTALSQFAGFGPSVDLVGYRNMTKALIQAMAHPGRVWQTITEKSGEMRHRAGTIDRDMKEELMKLRGVRGKAAAVKRTAFILTAMADRVVSVPTWLAGYNKAIGEGLSEGDAIRMGDRAVRLSQGGGGAKDLAAVQRENELMKLLTMYYTPFSALYARLRDVGHTTRGPKDLPRAVARTIALVILPAVLSDLLVGRGPDDDEDDVWWAARKVTLYPFQSVPFVRDVANVVFEPKLAKLGGASAKFKPGYKITPMEDSVRKVIKAIENLSGAWDGDKPWDDVAWDAFEASGYLFGLPTAQTRITGEYLEDMLTEGDNQDNLSGIVFRRHK